MRSEAAVRPRHELTFERACAPIQAVLEGDARRTIVAEAAALGTMAQALRWLRDRMRANVWRAGDAEFDMQRTVQKYDRRTRLDGFHVLHDWDGIADKVNPEIIPIDVLDYVAAQRGDDAADPIALAVLLDYYFMHLLALLSVRLWDDGDPDDNLDRVDRLLEQLQGPNGSGQLFAADAHTLLLIATSHYELQERGYTTLLQQVRGLAWPHQVRIALGHASSIGNHLRFGFEATYGRDTVNMRTDNVADYPWLCFALATLMKEYVRLREQGIEGADVDAVVEAMLNGLSPDARAFVGMPPSSLSECEIERSEFTARFREHRARLIHAFEGYRPQEGVYSPLSFFFNFSHNVVKGAVVDALLRGRVWALTLNDLLTTLPANPDSRAQKQALAQTLMTYARANPHKIRGRMMPVIVYDPQKGRQAFSVALQKMRE
jgi:hypothetical protein